MTAIATRKPQLMTLNEDGQATSGYETIEIPMPAETRMSAKVCVGLYPRSRERLPGWYAEAILGNSLERAQSAAGRERWHAVSDAVEALTNRLVDAADRERGNKRQWLARIITALNAWNENFERAAKKEGTMTTTTRTKMLNGRECQALLEDFRRCYQTCMQRFVELGEKAEKIREQEAYGDQCETFDQWIKSEGYGHTFVYDCMKAARLYRLMAPTLQPRQITLDCESHYRDIPADATPKEAKAIAAELVKAASGAGSVKITRQQVKAAVEKVRPKTAANRTAKPVTIDVASSAVAEDETPKAVAPRVAPETITGEYAEVASEQPAHEADATLRRFDETVKSMLQPLLQRFGHDGKFLYALAMRLHDLSAEVRYYEPQKSGRKAK